MQCHTSMDMSIARIIIGYLYIRIIYNVFRRLLHLSSNLCLIVLIVLIAAFILKNYRHISMFLLSNGVSIAIAVFAFELPILLSLILGYASNTDLIKYSVWLAADAFFYIMGKQIYSFQYIYNELFKNSFYMLLILSLSLFYKSNETLYIMSHSYYVLICLLLFTNELFNTISIKMALCGLWSLFLIISLGSRGPVLCYAVFVLLKVFVSKSKWLVKAGALSIGVLLIVFYNEIGGITLRLLSNAGIHNRTLTLLFTNLEYTSGRTDLQKIALFLFKQRPLLGYGVGADLKMIGQYPHNIVIELLFDYGIIISIPIFLFLTYCIIKMLTESSSLNRKKEFLLVLFAYEGVPLMLSGSYVMSIFFFLWIGSVCNKTNLNDSKRLAIDNG